MVRTISQRELRNESAAVMDAVERGETVLVTRNGHPLAELRPVGRRRFAATAELLRDFRGMPAMHYEAMRAEADQVFGDDRIDD
jgi:prevent-host-death family protein